MTGTTSPIGALPSLPEAPGTGDVRSWLDVQGLKSLETASASSPRDPATLRAVAQQFESLFIGMMMKSMREAKLGDGLFDSDQSRFYQELFDQQLSMTLAQGKGLGIADLLVRTLGPGSPAAAAAAAAGGYGRPLRRAGAPAGAAPLIGGSRAADGSAPLDGCAPDAPREAADCGGSGAAATAFAGSAGSGGGPGGVAGSAAASGAGAAHGALAASPEEFVALVMPVAQAAGSALGVSPLALVAQAALESNWGRQVPAAEGTSSFNLFGIKADAGWPGRRVVRDTIEYAGGIAERRREPFRAYESVTHAFEDYVSFLRGHQRFAGALQSGADPERFAVALHQAGYATDRFYSAKITAVLRSSTFRNAVAALKDADEPPIF